MRWKYVKGALVWVLLIGALGTATYWGLRSGAVRLKDLAELILPWTAVLLAVGTAFVATASIAVVIHWSLKGAPDVQRLARKTRAPLFVVIAGVLSIAAQNTVDVEQATPTEQLVILVASATVILSVGWLLTATLEVCEFAVLTKYSLATGDPRRVAKFRTQIVMLRHVLSAVIIVLSFAGVLMLVPQIRAFGTGLLASAGVFSVVAGLALQNSLSNLFAGIQIAFGDSVRVEDTIVVDGEQGQVEEMTLTYIVVRTPDNRRLILPSTYLVTTPFENWTRTDANMTGFTVIELAVGADITMVRDIVTDTLSHSSLWNGNENSVDVVGVVDGLQQVNIVVSATTPDNLYELQAHTRETVIARLRAAAPAALPAQRVHLTGEDLTRQSALFRPRSPADIVDQTRVAGGEEPGGPPVR